MKYRKGYKYQLAKDEICTIDICPPEAIDTEFISLSKKGILGIKQGYAWDGCSGPTIDTKSNMRGGLVHDALYQLMRAGKLPITFRIVADDLLKSICLEDGMWKIRAKYFHIGVRKGAAFAADPKNKKKVFKAP